MASTNYTITGTDFRIKTPQGELFQDGGMALVQWELDYDPAVRPLSEWTSSHLTGVWWTAWYQLNFNNTGHPMFGSNGATVDTAAPLYLFIDFGNSSNYTPTMANQVWMGQITDVLTLPGGNVEINLNAAHIRSVVGYDNGFGGLYSMDWNSWQPIAVPEPSYFGSVLGGVLLAGAVLGRLWRQKAAKRQAEG
jgi:hypothetical protein